MGRDFVHLEAQVAAARRKSGCKLYSSLLTSNSSGLLFVYPYGDFYDIAPERLPFQRAGEKDIIVYVHTEGQERTIGSLEGIFVTRKPIDVSDTPGANIPCRREQMQDFEKRYEGEFISFDGH